MEDRIDNISDIALSKSIVLVGLMGAGKSSIGRKLAEVLGLPFRDSDGIVEEAADCSVAEIYELWGEKEFRRLEKQTINRLLNGPICVLSTGDGAFLFNEEVIRENSVSIWINAAIDLLHKRVVHRDTRPQLNRDSGRTVLEALEDLLKDREEVYSRADIIVDSYDEPYKITVTRILNALCDYLRGEDIAKYHMKNKKKEDESVQDANGAEDVNASADIPKFSDSVSESESTTAESATEYRK